MVLGTNKQGETSAYGYNALGVRVLNVQEQKNINYDFRNYIGLGSRYLKHDYLDIYKIDRNDWQPTWETGAGHIVQMSHILNCLTKCCRIFREVCLSTAFSELSPKNISLTVPQNT